MSSSLLWVYSTRGWHKNTGDTGHDQVMSAKGTRVCFDTGDYHSIAVLDSGWPFAGILPLPRKLIGILLNLRQRVNPRNSDHPKSRITPLVIVVDRGYKSPGNPRVAAVMVFDDQDLPLEQIRLTTLVLTENLRVQECIIE